MADVRELRADVGRFAVEVGRPLADWQREDLALDAPITCLLWGRQMGKSRGLALLALWAAFRRPGQVVLVVSGGGEAGARRLLREVRDAAEGWPALRSSVEEAGANLLRLSNGSEVRSVAASEGSVRGWSVDLLLVDEAQLVGDSLLLSAALPTVSARPDARVVLALTASIASGAAYDLCRRGEVGGDPSVRFSRRVSRLVGGEDPAPWQNPTIVEASVRAMGSIRADAEHRCAWSSGSDALFTVGQLAAITLDYEVPDLHRLYGPARLVGGLDPGASHDRSALAAVGRLPTADGRPLFGVVGWRRWEAGHPLTTGDLRAPGVAEQVAALPASWDTFVGEANGLGEAVVGASGVLWRLMAARSPHLGGARRASGLRVLVEPLSAAEEERDRLRVARRRAAVRSGAFTTRKVALHVTAPAKGAMYSALTLLVSRRALAVPASAVELRRALLALRVGLSESGAERVTAARDSEGHADLASAVALCTMVRRGDDGAWRSRLAGLADPSRVALPDPPPDLTVGPTVRAAEGDLEVPRRPAVLSVAGPEATRPGAAAPNFHDLEAPIPTMRRA